MQLDTNLYRQLPAVNDLLRDPALVSWISAEGQAAVTDACRNVLSRLREEIASGQLDGHAVELALSGIVVAIGNELRQSLRYSLRPLINATGVVLHTNLGRAPLSAAALEHVRETASSYSNLELDLESGERGKRDGHVDRLFRKLLTEDAELRSGRAGTPVPPQSILARDGPTDELGGAGVVARPGAPNSPAVSTIVVNNNAAAVLLALNTLAEGGEVIVSRGELVEIGGSFRIPDVMGKSGATLREVGTTNRTRISDYEQAINFFEEVDFLPRPRYFPGVIGGHCVLPNIQLLRKLAGSPLLDAILESNSRRARELEPPKSEPRKRKSVRRETNKRDGDLLSHR